MKLFSALVAAGAVGLSLAFTVPASAQGLGDNFTVDQTIVPGAVPGPIGPIDKINFSYAAHVKQTNDGSGPGGTLDGDVFFEDGFYSWGAFVDDANAPVASNMNGPAPAGYKGYGIFSATGTAALVGGQINVTFTAFTIDMFVDPNQDTTFVLPADPQAGSTGRAGQGEDIQVGKATLLLVGEAHIFAGLANGDFEVILSDFTEGTTFFLLPDPFYQITNFAGVTTKVLFPGTATEGCASATAAFTCRLEGDGAQFFSVPEPGTLGLLGAGLVGAAAFLRRRKTVKAA